jgi:hypothetical protein
MLAHKTAQKRSIAGLSGRAARLSGDAPARVPPVVEKVLQSPGRPLDPETRVPMERRFNYDFGKVRVHADSRAAESARQVNARAYTVGPHIVFASGEYYPRAGDGQRLLAHEIAHVVQQGRGTGSPIPLPDSSLEREADHAASDFTRGSASIHIAGSSGAGLARSVAPRSLDRGLDPSVMSEEEIGREIELITRWLKDSKTSPEAGRLAETLASLKEELGRRPVKKAQAGPATGAQELGESHSAQLRFPLPRVSEPVQPVAQTAASGSLPSINTPPPPAPATPSLESMLPAPPTPSGPSALDRDLLGLGSPSSTGVKKEPVRQVQVTPPATPTGAPAQKTAGETPGLGTQLGTGEQAGLRLPHRAFQYVQLTVEWSNKYALSLDEKTLPPFLSGLFKSVNFIGEPGLAFQYHLIGDQPGNVDAQLLLKLVQLSMRAIDVSLVGGGQFTDLGRKWNASRVTPLAGFEAESAIVHKGPVKLSWVLDGLAAYPQPDAPAVGKPGQPPLGRVPDAQLSGELRLGIEWP